VVHCENDSTTKREPQSLARQGVSGEKGFGNSFARDMGVIVGIVLGRGVRYNTYALFYERRARLMVNLEAIKGRQQQTWAKGDYWWQSRPGKAPPSRPSPSHKGRFFVNALKSGSYGSPSPARGEGTENHAESVGLPYMPSKMKQVRS